MSTEPSIYNKVMDLVRNDVKLFNNSNEEGEEKKRKINLLNEIKLMMTETTQPSKLSYGYAALKKFGDLTYKHPTIEVNLKTPINVAKIVPIHHDEKFQSFFSELKKSCPISAAAWYGNWFEMIFVAYSHLNFNYSFDIVANDKFKNYLHMLLPCYYENYTGQSYAEVDRKRNFIMSRVKDLMNAPTLMYDRTCMKSYLHFLTLKCWLEDSVLSEEQFICFMNAIDRALFMYFDCNIKNFENYISMIIMKTFFTIQEYAESSYDLDYQVRAVMNKDTGKYGKIDLLIGNVIIDVKTCSEKREDDIKELETHAHFYQMLIYKNHIDIKDDVKYLVTINPITNLITFFNV